MAIPKGHRKNLQTIIRAAEAGHLALMECTRKTDGQQVYVLCAVGKDGDDYVFSPFAEMFTGDSPYDQWEPPL